MEILKRFGWLSIMLIFMPISAVLHWQHADAWMVFATSAAAIIPLAGLMGKSTEEIAHKMGPGIGGLMNASFGNAAEFIIALSALRSGMVDVVKASITGSILGNILLVLGLSCLAGGVKYRRQTFNATAAGMAATMLALAAVALLIPAVFHAHLYIHHQNANEQEVSLEIAIVLFVVYILMLLFSLVTHRHLYEATTPELELEAHTQVAQQIEADPREAWPTWFAVLVLIAATLSVAWMSEQLVGAIEETRELLGWTELFVGVIIVAIIGNAAEHSTAILVAMKNKMELSIQIAVGSGLQIALFIAPLLVFLSYLPGMPQIDLIFSMLEVVAVATSVLVVALVAYDGQTNWFEGLLLLAVYLILAIAFYHLPPETENGMNSTLMPTIRVYA